MSDCLADLLTDLLTDWPTDQVSSHLTNYSSWNYAYHTFFFAWKKKQKTSYSVYLQSVATFSIAKSVNGSEDLFYKLRLKGETPKPDPFFSFTFHIQITLLYKSLRVVTRDTYLSEWKWCWKIGFKLVRSRFLILSTVNCKCSHFVNSDCFPSNYEVNSWNLKTSLAQNNRPTVLSLPLRRKTVHVLTTVCFVSLKACLSTIKMVCFQWGKDVVKLLNAFRCVYCFFKLLLNNSVMFFLIYILHYIFKEILVFEQEIKETAVFVRIRFFPKCLWQKNSSPLRLFDQDGCKTKPLLLAVRRSRIFALVSFLLGRYVNNTLEVHFFHRCCWCCLRWEVSSLACCVVMLFRSILALFLSRKKNNFANRQLTKYFYFFTY